jgi:hypothetical protein
MVATSPLKAASLISGTSWSWAACYTPGTRHGQSSYYYSTGWAARLICQASGEHRPGTRAGSRDQRRAVLGCRCGRDLAQNLAESRSRSSPVWASGQQAGRAVCGWGTCGHTSPTRWCGAWCGRTSATRTTRPPPRTRDTHRSHDGVECIIDLAPVRRLAAPHPVQLWDDLHVQHALCVSPRYSPDGSGRRHCLRPCSLPPTNTEYQSLPVDSFLKK